MAVFQPYFFNSTKVSCNPSIKGRFSRTCAKMRSGAPFNVPTRRRKLCSKSNSPRIAAAVMVETSSPVPANFAISSIHSILIAVLSMSITSNPAWFKLTLKLITAASNCNSCAIVICSFEN